MTHPANKRPIHNDAARAAALRQHDKATKKNKKARASPRGKRLDDLRKRHAKADPSTTEDA